MRKNNAPVRVRFNKEREVRARVHRGTRGVAVRKAPHMKRG